MNADTAWTPNLRRVRCVPVCLVHSVAQASCLACRFEHPVTEVRTGPVWLRYTPRDPQLLLDPRTDTRSE